MDKNLKGNNNKVDLSDFQDTFIAVLHTDVFIKNKIVRFNNTPFMSNAIKEKQLCIDEN